MCPMRRSRLITRAAGAVRCSTGMWHRWGCGRRAAAAPRCTSSTIGASPLPGDHIPEKKGCSIGAWPLKGFCCRTVINLDCTSTPEQKHRAWSHPAQPTSLGALLQVAGFSFSGLFLTVHRTCCLYSKSVLVFFLHTRCSTPPA